MPELKAAYDRFKSRGFEIIGMNVENSSGKASPEEYARGIQKAREVLTKNGCTWTQAAQESVEDLVLTRIAPLAYPTVALLGPDGKIVSMEVRGRKLEKTLQSLLADKAKTDSAN